MLTTGNFLLYWLLATGSWLLPFPALAVPPRPRDVQHPFMLWTKEQVAEIRHRIKTEPWAREELERRFAPPRDYASQRCVDNLFRYLVLEDLQAAEVEKKTLVGFIGHPTLEKDQWDWQWHHADTYQHALRFDALQDVLTAGQRKALEETFRTFARWGIEKEPLRGFGGYGRHMGQHILALALRDERLIRGIFECKNGMRDYFDGMLDGRFAPGPLVGEIMLWCQACQRLGLDEMGYGYVGKGDGSMRKLLEGWMLLGMPRTDIPGGLGYYSRAYDMGRQRGGPHGLFPRELFGPPLVVGRLPGLGLRGGSDHWVPGGASAVYAGDRHVHRMDLPLIYELAHRQWPEAGFDYFLARTRIAPAPATLPATALAGGEAPPARDQYLPSLYWGLKPIDRAGAAAKPPPAFSGAYPQLGLALLRAQEGTAYWESPAPAAVLAGATPEVGRDGGCLALAELHAFNRPLYATPLDTDQFSASAWSPSGRCNNSVIVDNLQFAKKLETRVLPQYVSYVAWPRPVGPLPFRFEGSGFRVQGSGQTPQLATHNSQRATTFLFAAIRAADVYPGVDMERALLLTPQYLLDVFRLTSDRPRNYHWIVHPIGQPVADELKDWAASPRSQLDQEIGDPRVKDKTVDARPGFLFKDERSLAAQDKPWSVAAIQGCPTGSPASSRLGEGWYARKIGVRMAMLGEAGTRAFVARPVLVRWVTPREDPRIVQKRKADYDAEDKGFTEIKEPQEPAKDDEKQGVKLQAQEQSLADEQVGLFSIVAARNAASTVFVALHEPFEAGRWKLQSFRRIQQTDRGLAVAVAGGEGSPVNDRLLVRYGDKPEEPITLAGDGESFTFAGRAFVRIGQGTVEASGDLRAMALKAPAGARLVLNGRERKVTHADGLLSFGP